MRASPLLRIACDPVARVWGGVGDLDIPADVVEAGTARYLGGGALVSIPELEQLINGTASRIQVVVSGVSAETMRLALEDAPSVEGARVDIGIVYFGDDLQIAEVEWLDEVRADSLTVDRARDGSTRSISLSLGTDNTERSKAPIALFTDADQRRKSPSDRIFDHVAGINIGTSRPFGPR